MQTFADLRGERTEDAGAPLFDPSAVIRRFDTPEFNDVTFYEVEAKSLLNRVPEQSQVPFKWTVNVYRGCSHACVYCFARPTHTYLGFDAGQDFDTKVVVKVNAAALLRAELKRRSWTGEHIAMGTNTDPYQRCEGRYRLTRAVLEILRDARNACSVLTKSPLITRDLDVLEGLADVTDFTASFSIGTLDEEVWRRTEPGTPHPRARVAALRRLREAGIRCGVLIAPVLPHISDHPEQLQAVARAVAEAGASSVSAITLHLRRGVKEEFLPWLEREYPELVGQYGELYPRAGAPKAVQERIAATVGQAGGRPADGGMAMPDARRRTGPAATPTPEAPPFEPEQLGLAF